jgi:uncharacterized Zn-finger protein
MANIEINLDFLIQDCLKAYTEETLEFEMPARSTTGQYDEFPGQLILPENILSFDLTEELSPVTPAEVSELPLALNNRFICCECSKPYRGKRELTRHMKKHSSPNKYSCTVEGCLQTTYRLDAMSSHVKIHEQRLKTQMERNSVNSLHVQSKIKKVIQKKD